MVAYRMQGNYNVETENGELVNTLSKTLGEPVEQDKDVMKYYYWSTDKSIVMSAGSLYDKIGDKAKGKVVFVVDGGVVCRITDIGMNKPLKEMDKEL